MSNHAFDHRPNEAGPIPGGPGLTVRISTAAQADPPLPHGWEARARFDGGWSLARSGRARQALAIRWATLALATITGLVFLFGHELLALMGRGIEPLALVFLFTGLVAIAWLEHRGPVYRLSPGRIERRSGLGGRFVRHFPTPSLVITAAGEAGWSVVLRHDQHPEILANGLSIHDSLALAGFVSRHAGARVDVPESLERELAEDDAGGHDPVDLESGGGLAPRTGTHG
jgi:hypothetical protein